MLAALTFILTLLTTDTYGLGSYQDRLAVHLPEESYVIPGQLQLGVVLPLRSRGTSLTRLCGSVNKNALEFIYVLKYAAAAITADQHILPNTTLGLYVVDDCGKQGVGMARFLQLLSNDEQGPMLGDLSLNLTFPPLGVLGPVAGHILEPLSHLAKVYGVPLVSPLGGLSVLADRLTYPTVFGVSPSTTKFAQVLFYLVAYFKWKYITLLYSDRDYGLQAYKEFHKNALDYGVCIADSIFIYEELADYSEAARKLIDAKAEVLIVEIGDDKLDRLLRAVEAQERDNSTNYILMMTHLGDFEYLSPEWRQRVDGSIQIQLDEPLDTNLANYLEDVWPGNELHNPWLQDYWTQRGWDTHCVATEGCRNFPAVVDEARVPLLSRSTNALYGMVQALHNVITRNCPEAFGDVERITACVDPSDITEELYVVTVTSPTRTFQFTSYGDTDVSFLVFQEQGPRHVQIGRFAVVGNEIGLDDVEINNSLLNWGSVPWAWQEEIPEFPKQICSEPCGPGEFKTQGELVCCWTCFACRDNEYVSENGTNCATCPYLHWPVGEEQLVCARVPDTYLTYSDTYGLTLSALSGVGFLLAFMLTIVVIRRRERRVIKGSGWKMLLVILSGLFLAFAAVFLHIAQPNDPICIAARCSFHMAFTLIFGPLLVKTNRIFQVFLAASKLSRRVYMGSEMSQQIAVIVILIIQVALTVCSLFLWPAVQKSWMPIETLAYVELYCDVPAISLIACTSFNLLLVLCCALLAFLARSLPDNFNESWYIFLCVCTTIFVWIAFFTTYFSAYYVYYKAALLAAALILNGKVVMLALFAPKIYALLCVSESDIQISNFSGTTSRGGTAITKVSDDENSKSTTKPPLQ